jgi:hypothetical protein
MANLTMSPSKTLEILKTTTRTSFPFMRHALPSICFQQSARDHPLRTLSETLYVPIAGNMGLKGCIRCAFPTNFVSAYLPCFKHYVRPIAREKPEPVDRPWPRLALLVYYVEQFWPQTKHLCALVSSLWKQMGWQVRVYLKEPLDCRNQ